MPEIEVVSGVDALAEKAAQLFLSATQQAVQARGRFSVALAGGSTPLRLYDLLASGPYTAKIDWSKCQLFWGDERCVPPNQAESNYFQAESHLIAKINIPAENIHRIHGELSADRAATEYQLELERYFRAKPVFDLILLGIGPDGHTASLFPGAAAVDEMEKWAVGVPHATPPPPLLDRVSLTLPVFNAARQVLFQVAGMDKASVMARILKKPAAEPLLPAQRVSPGEGKLLWLIEQSALGN